MSKEIVTKKHRQSKFLTLMIVPYSSKKMLSFKIPHWFFHIGMGFISIVVSVALFFYLRTAYFQSLAKDVNRDLEKTIEMNDQLKDEKNKALESYRERSMEQQETYQQKLDFYDQKAAELEEKLNELEKAREELSDILNLSAIPTDKPLATETSFLYALGGAAETSLDTAYEVLELQISELTQSYDTLLLTVYEMKELEKERVKQQEKENTLPFAFSWPAKGFITSEVGSRGNPFGGGGSEYHTGIDISVPIGTEVKAAAGGVVKFSGVMNGYGSIVIISHSSGLETYYGHNSKLLVSKGTRVSKGDVIALSGNTGRSTGPHVHFEARLNGQVINPRKYIQ